MKQSVSPVFMMGIVALSLSSISVMAEDGFRQHEAHVHGSVEFNIAQDGQNLLVEILAPGADVVGFEHAPKNEQQTDTLNAAITNLNNADSILKLMPSAGCSLVSADINHTLGGDHEAHHADHENDHDAHDHDTHAHDHHAHDEEHAHSGHDHAEHHDDSAHGAFNIAYEYQCENVAKLSQIDTDWFKIFPATQAIHVNLLTDSAQLAVELKPAKTIIKL